MNVRSMISLAALAVAAAMPAAAATQVFNAMLTGPAEAPPNASPGTGSAIVTINDSTFSMHVQASFSGLLSPTTNSHIHCCTTTPGAGTAGVATATPTFPGFPSGVTFGAYDATFDMTSASSWNTAFINANGGTPATAFTTFLAGMNSGRTYFNIHTVASPGGEIRGFLAAPIPEPQTYALMLAGLGLVAAIARRRRG